MPDRGVILVTGTSKGIGRHVAEHYATRDYQVVGCSRGEAARLPADSYRHFRLDVADEPAVKEMFATIRGDYGRLDALVNNAGIASMNHVLTTPLTTVFDVLRTNVAGTFLLCREAAKLMQRRRYGRIVNFATVATPLKLEGEAIYAASKAAVISLTEVLARELADFGITVNAIGPTPIRTDLVAGVPSEKLEKLIARQAIRRFGEMRDVVNVIDFFLRGERLYHRSDLIPRGRVMAIGFLLDAFAARGACDAIVWRNQTFSYDWLSERIARWRQETSAHNIAPGAVVAIEADFSPGAVALFLALVEHGAILVPLTSSLAAQAPSFSIRLKWNG